MSKDKQSAVAYVVKDEHTLGYIFDAQPGLIGVLSSNKHGHHPHGGPVSIFGANIRPATAEDFATFRVVVPPYFNSEQVHNVQLVLCNGHEADRLSACSCCGNEVDNIVGCPDGAELCPQCFDAGGN